MEHHPNVEISVGEKKINSQAQKTRIARYFLYWKSTIKVPEAALRWIFNHSALDGSRGDSVILGASKVEQVHKSYYFSDAMKKISTIKLQLGKILNYWDVFFIWVI